MTTTRALSVLLVLAFAAAGCSWSQHFRPVRDAERLQVQSAVVTAPQGPGWRVERAFDAGARGFELMLASESRSLDILEVDLVGRPAATFQELRDRAATATRDLRTLLGDPAAIVTEIPSQPAARFGDSASLLVQRAEESDAKAGLLVKHVAYVARLAFVPPGAPDRACAIWYGEHGAADELTPERFEHSWNTLLHGVELRPASPEHIAAAARADDFPKSFQPGLARRSLTLPQAGFQWELRRERWVRPGGFGGGWGLGIGVTDHLEVETPGYLRYAFGEVEALTRPELAVGAGLTGVEHDALRGNLWAGGVSLEARRRLAADVAWRGLLFGELAHESRTGRDHLGGDAVSGFVWDLFPWASLGLEAGYASRPWKDASSRLAWVGGHRTPLVTVHLPFLDVGLRAAVAWDHGRPGLLAGFSVLLTL